MTKGRPKTPMIGYGIGDIKYSYFLKFFKKRKIKIKSITFDKVLIKYDNSKIIIK
jgi:hypothetical protein